MLALVEQLDVPLRERNALMLAAGYAPTYAESDLGSAETQQAREALERLLADHEPYPAAVLDRWDDVVLTNRAVGALLEGVDAELLAPPIIPTGSACTRKAWSRASAIGKSGPLTSDTGWADSPGSPVTRGSPSCLRRSAPTPASPKCSTTATNRPHPSCC